MTTKTLVINFEEVNNEIYCNVENKGFTAIEILGLLEARKFDLLEQVNHATKYERSVINEDGTRTKITRKDTEEE